MFEIEIKTKVLQQIHPRSYFCAYLKSVHGGMRKGLKEGGAQLYPD
jgi:hypothetical protein